MRTRPKILFLCDRRGWAFDTCARNLERFLSADYDVTVNYVIEKLPIEADRYDLIYVFWWGEAFHRQFVDRPGKVIKEISSHRWEVEAKFGYCTPREAVSRYMSDAGHLVATSRRLHDLFRDEHPSVHHYSLGVDTDLFRPLRERTGPMLIGWAGNAKDATKGLHDVVLPACKDQVPPRIAGGGLTYEEMADFYNGIDVLAIGSLREGSPLPLLEAMACGCFPVTTDVGVVPEIVVNGRNGLVVGRDVASFSAGFEWCKEHLAEIRECAPRNAALIRSSRTWESSARQLSAILDDILKRA